jgi:hypothetical protein
MFAITDRAKTAIKNRLIESTDKVIPMVTWSYDEMPEDGFWVLKYIERKTVLAAPPEVARHVIRHIADMEIIVDGPAHWEHLLEGRVLDFIAGELVFALPASYPTTE